MTAFSQSIRKLFPYLLACAVVAGGCASEPGAASIADEEGAEFTTEGGADTGGVRDGSREALGVLRVANELDRDTMVGDVQLSERVADALLAFRAGDDEEIDTEDDATFETLAELDAVPYVGPRVFAAMLEYAREHELVPAAPSEPTDPFAMTEASYLRRASRIRLIEAVESGLDGRRDGSQIGTFVHHGRSRECNAAGCGEWRTTIDGNPGVLYGNFAYPMNMLLIETTPSGGTVGARCFDYGDDADDPRVKCNGDLHSAASNDFNNLNGRTTASRMFLKGNWNEHTSLGNWTEHQHVVLARIE